MSRISPPRQCKDTGEWYYNGTWYDNYPFAEIERDEDLFDVYMDREER